MAVQAKFFVSVVERNANSPTASRVKLGAVCRGRENREWAQATPFGSIEMGILNEAATAYFEQGQEYLVTFTKVAKPMPGDGHKAIPAKESADAQGKPLGHNMCEFCGGYAAINPEDGSLDWTAHDSTYGGASD